MNKDIKIYNGEALPERQDRPQNMMRLQTQFVTAAIVPVPRDEKKIIANIEAIAKYVGHAFFYLWPIKDKKGNVTMISGGTIDLAETMLYYWSNIVIEHDIEDLGNKWKIKHVLIDCERGLQWPRTTIIAKPKEAPGSWDKDRWERMALNKANSYNLRDLVFSVIPRWMKDKIIEVAKKAEIEKAIKEFDSGIASDFLIQIKNEFDLSEKDLLSFFNAEKLNKDVYYKIKNIYSQLKAGDIKPSQVRSSSTKSEKSVPTVPKKEKQTKKEPSNDKIILIKQIYMLAAVAGIPVEAIEEMLGVKTLQSVDIGVLDGMINEWDDIKAKFMPKEEKENNLI